LSNALAAPTLAIDLLPRRNQAFWPRFARSLRSARLAMVGLGILVLVGLMAIFAPFLAPGDPNDVVLAGRLRPPVWDGGSWSNPLGTDGLGRDIYTRIVHGSRASLLVALAAVVISGLIGVALGLGSGYFGRRVDDVIMRIADVQLAFPPILLYVGVLAMLGAGLFNVIAVLGVSRWVVYARVVRGEAMSIKQKEFVEAARTAGAGDLRIIVRHILPNLFASIIVIASFSVATTMITEASLSFLGLGVPAAIPTWGGMLNDGKDVIRLAWWPATLPGLAIMLAVLGINCVGDWLRDFLDPRLRNE
jgi:peptide/nickel transport system permease protein